MTASRYIAIVLLLDDRLSIYSLQAIIFGVGRGCVHLCGAKQLRDIALEIDFVGEEHYRNESILVNRATKKYFLKIPNGMFR
jgi:hypothetical protein